MRVSVEIWRVRMVSPPRPISLPTMAEGRSNVSLAICAGGLEEAGTGVRN